MAASPEEAHSSSSSPLNRFLEFVLNSSKLDPKLKNDVYKVIHCILYIQNNMAAIAKKVDQKASRAMYASDKDHSNGVLRDDENTSFHIMTYRDGKHFITSMGTYIREIKAAVTLMEERGEEILAAFAQSFSYDEAVGCLEARTAPALAYCQRQVSGTFDLTDEISRAMRKLDEDRCDEKDKPLQLLIEMQHFLGRQCIFREGGDKVSYKIFNAIVLKSYLVDMLGYDLKELAGLDEIIEKESVAHNSLAVSYETIEEVKKHCKAILQENLVKKTIGQYGMVKFFFKTENPAKNIIEILHQQSNLRELGISRCKVTKEKDESGEIYYIFRLTLEQHQFIFGERETNKLLEKRVAKFDMIVPQSASSSSMFSILNYFFTRHTSLYELAQKDTADFLNEMRKADRETLKESLMQQNSQGETALHLSVKYQSKGRFVEAIEFIHAKDKTLLFQCLKIRDKQGNSFLEILIRNGANGEIAQLILNKLEPDNLYQILMKNRCSLFRWFLDDKAFKFIIKQILFERFGDKEWDSFMKPRLAESEGNIHDVLFYCVMKRNFELFVNISAEGSLRMGENHLFSLRDITYSKEEFSKSIMGFQEKFLWIMQYIDSTVLVRIIKGGKENGNDIYPIICAEVVRNEKFKNVLLETLSLEILEHRDYIIYSHILRYSELVDFNDPEIKRIFSAIINSFSRLRFLGRNSVQDAEILEKLKTEKARKILDGISLVRLGKIKSFLDVMITYECWDTVFYLIMNVHEDFLGVSLTSKKNFTNLLDVVIQCFSEEHLICLIERAPAPMFFDVFFENYDSRYKEYFYRKNKNTKVTRAILMKLGKHINLHKNVYEKRDGIIFNILLDFLEPNPCHKQDDIIFNMLQHFLRWNPYHKDVWIVLEQFKEFFVRKPIFICYIVATQPAYIVEKFIHNMTTESLCKILKETPTYEALIPIESPSHLMPILIQNQPQEIFYALKEKVESEEKELFIDFFMQNRRNFLLVSLFYQEELLLSLLADIQKLGKMATLTDDHQFMQGFLKDILLYHSVECIQIVLQNVMQINVWLKYMKEISSSKNYYRDYILNAIGFDIYPNSIDEMPEKFNTALCYLMCEKKIPEKEMVAIFLNSDVGSNQKTKYVSLLTLCDDEYFFGVIRELKKNGMLLHSFDNIYQYNAFERSLILSIVARESPEYFTEKNKVIHIQVQYYRPRTAGFFITCSGAFIALTDPNLENILNVHGIALPVDKWLIQCYQQTHFSHSTELTLLKMRREDSAKTVQSAFSFFDFEHSLKESRKKGDCKQEGFKVVREDPSLQAVETLILNKNCLVKVIQLPHWDAYIAQLKNPAERNYKVRCEGSGTHKYKHMSDSIVPYEVSKQKQPKKTIKKNSTTLVSYDQRHHLWPYVFGSHDKGRPLVGLLFDKTQCVIKAQLSSDHGTYTKLWVGTQEEVEEYRNGEQVSNYAAGQEMLFWQKVACRRRYNEVLAETCKEAIVGIVICREDKEDYKIALNIQKRLIHELGVNVPIFIYEASARLRLYPEAFVMADNHFGLHYDAKTDCMAYAMLIDFKQKFAEHRSNGVIQKIMALIEAAEKEQEAINGKAGLWSQTLTEVREILQSSDNAASGIPDCPAIVMASMSLGY